DRHGELFLVPPGHFAPVATVAAGPACVVARRSRTFGYAPSSLLAFRPPRSPSLGPRSDQVVLRKLNVVGDGLAPWELHGEGRPVGGVRPHVDRSTVRDHDLLTDIQAEPEP